MAVESNLSADELVLFERLIPLYEQEAVRMAKSLASKKDEEMFGKNEYEIRDRVHELGAKALEIAVNERQKKGLRRGS